MLSYLLLSYVCIYNGKEFFSNHTLIICTYIPSVITINHMVLLQIYKSVGYFRIWKNIFIKGFKIF